MSARDFLLLGTVLLLSLAPLAGAGSSADPETGHDVNDDVSVNGGVNCGLPAAPPFGTTCLWPVSTDFEWANTDIDWAWVNDTAPDLVFTLQMKAGTSFTPGSEVAGHMPAEQEPFTYTYTFAFTVDGVPFAAIATMGTDGVFTLSGVASTFLVHDGNQLTVTVPKALVSASANGAVIGALTVFAHGEDDNGNTLDDQAPDEGAPTSRDYAVANSTAAAPAPAPANNTANATSGTHGPALASSTGPTRGPVSGSATATATSSTAPSTGGFGLVPSKDSPAVGPALLALTVVALAIVLRRRL